MMKGDHYRFLISSACSGCIMGARVDLRLARDCRQMTSKVRNIPAKICEFFVDTLESHLLLVFPVRRALT